MPWFPPQVRSEESYLIQNFLDFELAQLRRFGAWSLRLSRVPCGVRFNEPLAVLLKPARLALSTLRALGDPVPYVGYPISGRPSETSVLLFPPESGLPPADRPVLLSEVRRVVIPLVTKPDIDFDYALRVEGWSAATEKEFLPALPPRREVADVIPAVLDEFGSSRAVVESSLLGFAGSPPIPGEGAGLDVTLGGPLVNQLTAQDAARTLAPMLPIWEKSPLAPRQRRIWAGNKSSYPTYVPFGVQLASYDAGMHHIGHPAGLDRSSVLAGTAAGHHLIRMLLGGDQPVLRPNSEIEALAMSRPRLEALVPALSLFVYVHILDVREPEESELRAAHEGAVEAIADGYRTFLEAAGMRSDEVGRTVEVSQSLRQSIRRSALARARLDLRSLVLPADFRGVGTAFLDSIATVTASGRQSDIRPYLVDASAELSAHNRSRLMLTESLLLANPGSTPEELWERVKHRDLWKDLRELEGYIDVLVRQGFVVAKSGRSLEWT